MIQEQRRSLRQLADCACRFRFSRRPLPRWHSRRWPSGGMGWPCRSVLGGDRIRAVSATESSLLRSFGAPLAFATLSPRAVRDANAPATTPLAHPSWLQRFFLAPCATQTPPLLAVLAHPSRLHFVATSIIPPLTWMRNNSGPPEDGRW